MKHNRILIRICIVATFLPISLVGCNNSTTDQPSIKTEQPYFPPPTAISTPAPLFVAPQAPPPPKTPRPNAQMRQNAASQLQANEQKQPKAAQKKLNASQQALAVANAKATAKRQAQKRVDEIRKQLAMARSYRVARTKYNHGTVNTQDAKIRSLEMELITAGRVLESQ